MSNFGIMVKPVGSTCNMSCKYCYYIENEMSHHSIMDHILLETTIKNYFESTSGPIASFVWHGGEPTLAGLDFYKRVVELQKKYLPKGWQCWNNLQTNGLLLDDDWFEFLNENHFDVGISLDATQAIHDFYRSDNQGNPTYSRVKRNIQKLKEYGVKADLLCTVTQQTTKDPSAVYSSLAELNTGWIQFIPIVNKTDGGYSEESVTPQAYGRFLVALFDEWLTKRIGDTDIQLFMELLNIYAGGQSSLCWLAEICGRIPVVEADGMVYSCDHYVNENNLIGDVSKTFLKRMMNSKHQVDFMYAKREDVCEDCLECKWWFLCHGACPKDRIEGKYYLCEGLKMLFEHSEECLKRAVILLKQGYNYNQLKDLW